MENSIFVSMVPSSGTILTNLLSDLACSDLNVKLIMPELLHIKFFFPFFFFPFLFASSICVMFVPFACLSVSNHSYAIYKIFE